LKARKKEGLLFILECPSHIENLKEELIVDLEYLV
jgi:hypothetical protein